MNVRLLKILPQMLNASVDFYKLSTALVLSVVDLEIRIKELETKVEKLSQKQIVIRKEYPLMKVKE